MAMDTVVIPKPAYNVLRRLTGESRPVDKREDSVVYRSALARIVEKVSVLANAMKKTLTG